MIVFQEPNLYMKQTAWPISKQFHENIPYQYNLQFHENYIANLLSITKMFHPHLFIFLMALKHILIKCKDVIFYFLNLYKLFLR